MRIQTGLRQTYISQFRFWFKREPPQHFHIPPQETHCLPAMELDQAQETLAVCGQAFHRLTLHQ
jgi:hypothetical protein